ncbi:MAG: YhdP family protein [Methylococcaceae bacterium]
MIHHIKRATRHLIFWSLIASAVSLTGVRLLLSGIENYKADLAFRISEAVGAPVIIGHLGAKMHGFSPELVLKNIAVASVVTNAPPSVQFKEIRLGFNLFNMLVGKALLPSSRVTLVGTKLSVTRKQDGSFAIVGLKAGDEQPLWLLQGGSYEVLQSEITWQDEKRKGRAIKFESVDLAIINDAQRHKINVIIKLPEKYGDGLTVAMDLRGNVFEPSSIDGAVYFEGKNLKLPKWVTVDLPLALNIGSGTADFKIWGGLQHSQLVSMNGEVQLQGMKIFHQDNDVFPIEQLETNFHWRFDGNQWRLDVGKFLLETANGRSIKKWPEAVFSVAGFANNGNFFHKIALFAEQVDLHEASSLVQFFSPLPDEQRHILAQTQLKGSLEKFSLFANLDEKTIAVNGKFSGLSIVPFAKIPGIDNLTGQIQGSEKAGVLRLATDGASIIAPDIFREAFIINSLKGKINWLQTEADWNLSSPMLELNLRGFQSKSRLKLTLPKTNDLPFLDMQSAFSSDDIIQLKHYLPVKVMKPADVAWFDRAYLGGRITKGGMLYAAKLGVFPSTFEEGVFEALFDVDQLDLAYTPNWPQINNLAGEVEILQSAMVCEIHQGQSNDLNITHATVTNPALGKSKLLMVKGEFEGAIANVFKFLQQTPLNSAVGFLVDAVVPQGDTQVALDLTLPLAPGIMPKVNGTAQLKQAKLNVLPLDLWINKIEGDLKFTEQGVYSDTIQASALGRPIKVNIKKADHQQTFVNITGSAEVDELQQQFKIPGSELAKGVMNYELKLGLPYPDRPSELVVQSDLAGVALNLPGFLAKTKNQQKPLSLTFGLGDEKLLPVAVNYNDSLKAAVKLDLAGQRLHSGHILVGPGKAEQTPETGLTLEINQEPLDLHDWLGLSIMQNNISDDGAANDIRQIKIHSQNAQWKNTSLGAFDLILKPDASHWAGTINSVFATGKILIPQMLKSTEKITFNMASVDLSALKQLKSQSNMHGAATEPELKPAAMPLLSVTSDKTLWGEVDLGRLTLETERIVDGLAFKQLELTGTEQEFKLSGDWKVNGQRSETRLKGRLKMPRAGKLLAQLDISKELMETSGDVDFSLNWLAAPYQFSLADLQGQVDINFNDGRLLSVEPGVGRVLGILAMEQWVKRLQLDFRDVYQEGLTFNNIKGHFDLLNGIATTNNLVVDAIPAKITLTGDTNFVNRTVDQVVNVAPKSADAVPIAGTIMGKMTTLITRTMTGKDHDGFFFGSQYRVKGKWDNLVIIPLHENDGLFQKTWNGITDFSWLNKQKQ